MLHKTVFLNSAVEGLNIKPGGIYIDGTFGQGGHSKLILSKLNRHGKLFAFDRDLHAVKIGKCIASKDKRFTITHSLFSMIGQYALNFNILGIVDGLLLDLGMSSLQLNDPSRGFSFLKNGPLDMRMDNSKGQSALEWLNKASEKDIFFVLKFFGEERYAKKISKSIINVRRKAPIMYTEQLSSLIVSTVPFYYRNKHPSTRSFQAIRIHINNELQEIEQILESSLVILSSGGRLSVISFHSLEDKLVKQFVKKYSLRSDILNKLPLTEEEIISKYQGTIMVKNIKRILPSKLEIKQNIKARSAVLRLIEKL